MSTARLVGLLCLLCLLLAAMPSGAQEGMPAPAWRIVDLGTLGGLESDGLDVNTMGTVTGWAADQGNVVKPVTWAGDVVTDLTTTCGAGNACEGGGMGVRINDSGQVAGWVMFNSGGQFSTRSGFLHIPGRPEGMIVIGSCGGAQDVNAQGVVTGYSKNGQNHFHGYVYDGTGLVTLDSALGSDVTSQGVAINDAGQVLALTQPSTGTRTWIFKDGTATDLGTLGGSFAVGMALNDGGGVAGFSGISSGDSHAFVHNTTAMTDLGTLGGRSSSATDVNNAGQAAGRAETAAGIGHAFFWDGSTMTDLGSLGGPEAESMALSLNTAGAAVGWSRPEPGSTQLHAVYWNGTAMIDLNDYVAEDSAWDHLSVARKIADSGMITGFGMTRDGFRHAFLAMPVSP